MGLNLRIHGINSNNDFTLSYYKGDTPNNKTFITIPSEGYSYSYLLNEIVISDLIIPFEYGDQYWFKITNNTTQNWVILNININEQSYYQDCISCDLTPTPTTTPGLTPTPTPTLTLTPTLTTTPTLTPTTTSTMTPTNTPTLTQTLTPTSTSTMTPTMTMTPTITDNCLFDVEVTSVIPPTPTPTPTPTVTLNCSFDVEITTN